MIVLKRNIFSSKTLIRINLHLYQTFWSLYWHNNQENIFNWNKILNHRKNFFSTKNTLSSNLTPIVDFGILKLFFPNWNLFFSNWIFFQIETFFRTCVSLRIQNTTGSMEELVFFFTFYQRQIICSKNVCSKILRY